MKKTFWLTINKGGSIRTTKSKPQLKWDEISIYVTIDVPSELFKRPTLSASIEIPQDKVPEMHIDAETKNELEEVLKTAGFNIKLHIKTNEDEED